MIIAGLGLIFPIIGAAFCKIKNENGSVQGALNIGNWLSIVLTLVASYFLIESLIPSSEISNSWRLFYQIRNFLGCVHGFGCWWTNVYNNRILHIYG